MAVKVNSTRLDDFSMNTIIGRGSSVAGNVKINGFVRIDGDIDGNLETDGNVLIGEDARIRGNINAKSIIIGGIIIGDIFAKESTKLLANSAVIGDIHSHKLQIEESAIFHGSCISIKDEHEYKKVVAAYNQSKAIKEKVSL